MSKPSYVNTINVNTIITAALLGITAWTLREVISLGRQMAALVPLAEEAAASIRGLEHRVDALETDVGVLKSEHKRFDRPQAQPR